ncbi:Gfo/Idh/MocA family protein [Aurantivibrio infirmus]
MSSDRFLLVGLGSIGKRHLSNLRKIRPRAFIIVLRSTILVTKETKIPLGADVIVGTIEEALLFSPRMAIIASPSNFHIDVAKSLAEHGIHLMIEKPISNNLNGVEELISYCENEKLILLTAYNFRFSRIARKFDELLQSGIIGKVVHVIVDTGQYLPDWRPGSDYKKGVSARAELGGGAVLELSHEIDYIRWFFGEVDTVFAKIKNSNLLEIDVEDSVDALLAMKTGVSINLHMDFLQRSPNRVCKVIGSKGTLIWDVIRQCIFLVDEKGERICLENRKDDDKNDMYLKELEHFIECVELDVSPFISGRDGLETLNIALAMKNSSANCEPVSL